MKRLFAIAFYFIVLVRFVLGCNLYNNQTDDQNLSFSDIGGPIVFLPEDRSSMLGLYGRIIADTTLEIEVYLREWSLSERGLGQPSVLPEDVDTYYPYDYYIKMASEEEIRLNLFMADIHAQARKEARRFQKDSVQYSVPDRCYDNLLICYAGILEGVRVVADKPIGGRPAGENLADLFVLSKTYSHFVYSYPSFDLKDYYPETISRVITFKDFYMPGVALPAHSVFVLKDVVVPSGENTTFSVQIPIESVTGYYLAGMALPEWYDSPQFTDTLQGAVTL